MARASPARPMRRASRMLLISRVPFVACSERRPAKSPCEADRATAFHSSPVRPNREKSARPRTNRSQSSALQPVCSRRAHHAEIRWPLEGSVMRKLNVSSFISLDGVIASPMVWTVPFFDDESKEYAYKQLADVEFLLLGRMTYELFSARWPQIKGDKYFDRINGLKKLVASTTLTDVTWNASVMNGDVIARLRTLKEQDGGTITKYGISQLDNTLLANKLVDEYSLWFVPTVVHQGKRAFEDWRASLPGVDLGS